MNRPDKFLFSILAFGAGIFIASFLFIKFETIIFFLILIFAAFLWGFLLNKKIIFWVVVGFLFIAGIIFYQTDVYFRLKNSSAYLNSHYFLSRGIIDEEPEFKETSLWLTVKLKDDLKGRVLIKTKLYLKDFRYGDEVKFEGLFEEPKNYSDFDFKAYLAKGDIYSVINYPKIQILNRDQGLQFKAKLFKIKAAFQEKINQLLLEPEASFLSGLILGERQSLDKNLKNNLQRSGTSHLIALSGYNITIIISAVFSLLLFFGFRRSWAFWGALLAIIFFILMTGASPSIVRAGIMGILAIFSQRVGRLYHQRNILFLAGLIMIILNPKILRFDVAFQLSFMATLGLIYFSPFFEKIFLSDKKSFLNWRGNLAMTLSAQAAVLPLLISNFGYISLVAPLANILILIFIPITMSLGFLTGVFGLIFNFLGEIISWLAYAFLKYEIIVINFFGSLRFSSFSLGAWREITFWLSVISVVALFIFVYKRNNGRFSQKL